MPPEIAAQLERILASPHFQRSRRSSQLLRFLADSASHTPGGDLKEYTIATEAFERESSFDPRVDPLVRVEATRLRARLRAYYDGAPGDSIQVTLPAGSYRLEFHERASAGRPAPSRPDRPWPRADIAWFALGGLAVFGTAVMTFWRISPSPLKLEGEQHISLPGSIILNPMPGPGGKVVYYTSTRGGGRLRLWRHSLESGVAQPLTPDGSDVLDADLSPDGSRIAYHSTKSGGTVFVVSTAGGAPLHRSSLGLSPRFSPDGKSLVFWQRDPHTGFGHLLIIPASGEAEPTAAAQGFDDAHSPHWTADGRILLCGTFRSNAPDKEHDIWIVDARRDAPIKTGILPYLAQKGIDVHWSGSRATAFRWYRDYLIFSGVSRDRSLPLLYTLTVRGTALTPVGEPRVISASPSGQNYPSLVDGRLAYSAIEQRINIWRFPLKPDGTLAGDPVRQTVGNGEHLMPAASADESNLFYLGGTATARFLWKRDLNTGVDMPLLPAAGINRLILGPNGKSALFRRMAGPSPQPQQLLLAEPPSSDPIPVCPDCGSPTSFIPLPDRVIFETGSRLARLGSYHIATGEKRFFLSHPFHSIECGRISPDRRWIAFELRKGYAGSQIFATPFDDSREIPEQRWIEMTPSSGSSFQPTWSLDGNRLYYLADEDGVRRLRVQRLEATTKRPVGGPDELRAFTDPSLTPLTWDSRSTRYIGLSVSRNGVWMAISELGGSAQWGVLR